ncbi:MAG: ABC transporter permease subunit [Planctomycetota bacterium]|nr:MAG: ABC transporter permease subunit [Planctomycetota bacterium]
MGQTALQPPGYGPRYAVRRALLVKEWREQRWRFFLGTVVLSGLLAGLLRAQVIPRNEAVLFIYWPVGLVMVIFFAMGSVATERANRTWEFLLSQPISRDRVLLAKWLMGFIQLAGMMGIATIAGALALWSRGLFYMPRSASVWEEAHIEGFARYIVSFSTTHPILWLCLISLIATVALSCWSTPLFFVLTRARNEFAAALGGILLTIVILFWLMNIFVLSDDVFRGIWKSYSPAQILVLPIMCLNPLTPLVTVFVPELLVWSLIVLPFNVLLWILLPIRLVRWITWRATVI